MDAKIGMPEVAEFKVGETYVNEKGPFEVISIHRDEMVIRWENGKEIRSSVDLQLRIQQRILLENRMREKKAAAAAAKSRQKGRGSRESAFEGLQDGDFQEKISKTKWRGRDQLGGAVTSLLPTARLKLQSWAAKGENEIHWLEAAARKADARCPIKFFARADEDFFSWGFSIDKPDSTTPAYWTALVHWPNAEENDRWLRDVIAEEQLSIYDNRGRLPGNGIRPGTSGWLIDAGRSASREIAFEEVIERYSTDEALDLRIARRIPKHDALNRGRAIADDIQHLFVRLIPLYEAAAAYLLK